MKAEKVLGNIYQSEAYGGEFIAVPFEWFETEKKRIRKEARDGTSIGIIVEEELQNGDILINEGEIYYYVELLPTDLIKITVTSIQEMGRLCFEIGNRHLYLSIADTSVAVPYDELTFQYLRKSGFDAVKVCEQFDHYTKCTGHEN